MGGLRHRDDRGRGRRRHDDRGHAAQLDPADHDPRALEIKRAVAEGQVRVDVGFWGGAVPGNLPDLAPLHQAGVFGFKCFLLDSGVEEFRALTAEDFSEAMRETAGIGALMIVHAEIGPLLDESALDGPHYAGFLASRPRAAENVAIALVIDQADVTGGRAHIVHLSSSDAVPRTPRRASGRRRRERRDLPALPDLRRRAHRGRRHRAQVLPADPRSRRTARRCGRALAAGDIDFVVSDHSPCTVDLKEQGGGDFGAAWGGIASVQLGLPAVWTGARARGHELADVVRWMATAPADRVGLGHKGRIEVGADADLVRFAPDEGFTVDVAALHHRNPVSAYSGRRLNGVVRETWLRGGSILLGAADAPRGRLLRRGVR